MTLNVLPGNTQRTPPGGYNITTNATVSSPITIEGNGNYVLASNQQLNGSMSDGIFRFIGADYVEIKNITIGEAAENTITDPVTNNMTEFGFALFPASPTDGAQHITIRDCNIQLNRMYRNTIGIYSTSRTNATAVTTINDISTPEGANHHLHIYNNNISNTNLGIVAVGTVAGANMSTGLDIGGSTPANGNTLTNYGTMTSFSIYPSVSISVNGIYVNNHLGFNIANNYVTSSDGGVTVNTPVRGIYVQGTGTLPVAGSFSNTITNNTVSVKSGATTSPIQGIVNEMGNPAVSINISSNIIQNTTHTSGSSGSITFISNIGACQNITLNANRFGDLNVSTTGNVTFLSNNAAYPPNAVVLVNENGIAGGFSKTGAGGTVFFYFSNANADPTASETNSNNNFSNVAVTGTTIIAGWQSSAGSSTPPYGPSKTANRNIFTNISAGSGQVTLLNVAYSNSTVTSNTISENRLGNVSSLGPIVAFISNQGSQNFADNTIHSMSGGTGAVTGVSITGGVTQNVSHNKIFDLSVSNTSSTVTGALISPIPAVINVYNNVIGRLYAPAASGTDVIRGISCPATTASTSVNILYNTIYLDAVSSGTNFGTSGIYHASSSTASSGSLYLANNVVVNNSIPNGTGRTLVFRKSSIAILDNYNNTSNNNFFYTITPGAGYHIFGDVGNSVQTLASFKTAVAPRESNSVSQSLVFLSTAGANGAFLRIDHSLPSVHEDAGIPVAWIPDDFNSLARHLTTPDMGAYEELDPNCVIYFGDQPLSGSICPGNTAFLGVTTFASPPESYQWYKGFKGDMSNPVGTNSQVYTTPPLTEVSSYWVKVYNSCGTIFSEDATIGILNSARWTGNVDNNWNTPGNWDGNCVPVAGMDIYIPFGNPTLEGGSATIRSVTIRPGANLHLSNGAVMNVTGHFINDGTIISSGIPLTGKIIFNGTAKQNIGGSGIFSRVEIDNATGAIIFSNLTFKNLELLNNTVLTTNSSIIIQ